MTHEISDDTSSVDLPRWPKVAPGWWVSARQPLNVRLRGIGLALLRLAAFFGTDAQSWMNLQTHYDTELARERIGTEFLADIRRHAAPA